LCFTLAISDPLAIFVDAAPLPEPAQPELAPGSGSGHPGDRITNVLRPEIRGVGKTGLTMELYLGAVFLTSVEVGEDRSYTATPNEDVPEGGHTITAVQVDGAGNQSAGSAALDLTIDPTRPTVERDCGLVIAAGEGICERRNIRRKRKKNVTVNESSSLHAMVG
jgi:hypothetical protein